MSFLFICIVSCFSLGKKNVYTIMWNVDEKGNQSQQIQLHLDDQLLTLFRIYRLNIKRPYQNHTNETGYNPIFLAFLFMILCVLSLFVFFFFCYGYVELICKMKWNINRRNQQYGSLTNILLKLSWYDIIM